MSTSSVLGEVDGGGVVDDDVDPAEAFDGGGDGAGDVVVVPDIAHERQRLAAGGLHLLRGADRRCLELGCGSPVLAIRAMLAPSRAARRAMARPMPRLPPDIRMVRPWREPAAWYGPAAVPEASLLEVMAPL